MNAAVKFLGPFGLLLLLAVLSYFSTLLAFHERWASSELGYSHGYPVLALCCYALYERRDNFFRAVASPLSLGLLALLVLSMAWFFANVIQIRILQQMFLPMVILGWVGTVFGFRALLVTAIPLGLIYLAVPFWDFLTDPLRITTVAVVQSLLELAELPAYIDGYFIAVPGGKFVVAGGCSGLNYVLTSLTLGVFYSLLYLKTLSKRVGFVLICIAFSLIVNWIRVFALVLIGLYTDMESKMVHDHETFGWVLFTLVLVPMFWIASRLEQAELKEERARASKIKADKDDRQDELSAEAAAKPQTSLVSAAQKIKTKHYVIAILATVVSAVGPLLALQLTANAGKNPKVFRVDIPAGWSAKSTVDVPWRPKFSGYDREVHWDLRYGFRESTLSFYHYDIQGQGRELIYHDNRIADSDEIAASGIVFVSYGEGNADVREFEVVSSKGRYLVWSLYWVANRPVSDDLTAKVYQVFAAMQGRLDAHLITLSAKCVGSSCASVRQRFQRVMPNLLEGLE